MKALFFVLILIALASCQVQRVLLIGGVSGTGSDVTYNSTMVNLVNGLTATGRFASVVPFNGNLSTPTIQELSNYTCVLVFADHNQPAPVKKRNFNNATALSEVLVEFINTNGGGVVVAADVTSGVQAAETLDWNVALYGVIQIPGTLSDCTNSTYNVTDTSAATQALFNNVTAFQLGTSALCSNSTTVVNGTISATLPDGRIAVAYRSNAGTNGARRRVDLGFYPDNDGVIGFSNTANGGLNLIANALIWAANIPPLTVAPTTTAPTTTAPVTTAPVTTAPVTTAPVTTAPVTTAPVTTAPVTTAPVTTAPVTTAPMTVSPTNTPRCTISTPFSGTLRATSTSCLGSNACCCVTNGQSVTFSISSTTSILSATVPNATYGTCPSNNAFTASLVGSQCAGTTTWENIGFTVSYNPTLRQVTMKRTSDSLCSMTFAASSHIIKPTLLLIFFVVFLLF